MSAPNTSDPNEQYVVSTFEAKAEWLLEQFNVNILYNHTYERHASPDVTDDFLVNRLIEERKEIATRFASVDLVDHLRHSFLHHFQSDLLQATVRDDTFFAAVMDCDTVIGDGFARHWNNDNDYVIAPVECTRVTFWYGWDGIDKCWVEITGFPCI